MTHDTLGKFLYAGDAEGLQHYLDTYEGTQIQTEFEPYASLQRTKQLECLTILMDDPRFVFDDLFVARMFYFSTHLLQRTIWKHPRMKAVLQGAPSLSAYFHMRYPKPTWNQSAGLGQRFFHADNGIRYLRKADDRKKNQRLLFFLVPAVVSYIRNWKKSHSFKA